MRPPGSPRRTLFFRKARSSQAPPPGSPMRKRRSSGKPEARAEWNVRGDDGSGLPVPRRRTFAAALQASALSDADVASPSWLRSSAYAGSGARAVPHAVHVPLTGRREGGLSKANGGSPRKARPRRRAFRKAAGSPWAGRWRFRHPPYSRTRRPSAWLVAAACTMCIAARASSRPLTGRTRLVTFRWNWSSMHSQIGRAHV